MIQLDGGCTCGKIRYQVNDEPVLSLLCFCSDCLSSFGCDGYPGMMVKNEHFAPVSGKPSTYSRNSAAGRTVVRHFCADCGTNVWGQTELGLVSIVAGTLDQPDYFTPTKAVFTSQAPSWARIPDHLEHE